MLPTLVVIACLSLLGIFVLVEIRNMFTRSLKWKKWSTKKLETVSDKERVVFKIEVIANHAETSLLGPRGYDEELINPRNDLRKLINNFDGANVKASHISQIDCFGRSNDDNEYPREVRKAVINIYTMTEPDEFNYGDCLRAIEEAASVDSRMDSFETVWIDEVEEPETDLRVTTKPEMDSDIYDRTIESIQHIEPINNTDSVSTVSVSEIDGSTQENAELVVE